MEAEQVVLAQAQQRRRLDIDHPVAVAQGARLGAADALVEGALGLAQLGAVGPVRSEGRGDPDQDADQRDHDHQLDQADAGLAFHCQLPL
ncbi:hypothetical protein D3C78_1541300 [compost metagenome]